MLNQRIRRRPRMDILPRYNQAVAPYRPRSRLPGTLVAASPFIARAVGTAYRAYKSYKDKGNKTKVATSMGQLKTVSRRPKVMVGSKKPTVKKLAKKIRDLSCLMNASNGELIYRSRVAGSILAGVKAQNANALGAFQNVYYEQVLGQLRYYDPSTPTALVTADGTSGTFAKDFCFTSNYAKLQLRNNYQVPVNVSVYYMQVKTDTSLDPLTAWSNGVADNSNVSYTSTLSYPTDSDQITSCWTIQKTVKKLLEPAETMICTHTIPKFDYNPAVADSQTETYRKEDKGFVFLVVVSGVIGHDTSLSQQTTLSCGVDYQLDRTSKVQYDAGANIKYIYCADNSSSSFTNGGVVSMKPIADNLGYSVA